MTISSLHLKPSDGAHDRYGISRRSTPASVDSVEDMIRLEPRLKGEDDRAAVKDVTPRRRNDPLPEEKFPRVIDKREPEQGYYIALGVVMSVWMITPLSW